MLDLIGLCGVCSGFKRLLCTQRQAGNEMGMEADGDGEVCSKMFR